jgi:TFIIF-interacting CTD phosphatase-like protein
MEDAVGMRFNVRPGCMEFLSQMAKHYEIVIFTAADQDYAD